MSGKGKYTIYVPSKSTKRTFFEKLFGGDLSHTPPFFGLDQDEAKKAANKIGNDLIRAASSSGIQKGDPYYLPDGVDMRYTGAKASIQSPDTTEGKDVTWKNPGDPANSYVPDITSPGPGKTAGKDKDKDPKITVADLKPAYVPAAPNTGTKSPTATADKIAAQAELGGTGLKPGDSGANT